MLMKLMAEIAPPNAKPDYSHQKETCEFSTEYTAKKKTKVTILLQVFLTWV